MGKDSGCGCAILALLGIIAGVAVLEKLNKDKEKQVVETRQTVVATNEVSSSSTSLVERVGIDNIRADLAREYYRDGNYRDEITNSNNLDQADKSPLYIPLKETGAKTNVALEVGDIVLRDGSVVSSNTLARIEAKRGRDFRIEGMIKHVYTYNIPTKFGRDDSSSMPVSLLSVKGSDGERYTLLCPNAKGFWPNTLAEFRGIPAKERKISVAQIINKSDLAGNPSLDDANYYDEHKRTLEADALVLSIKYLEGGLK